MLAPLRTGPWKLTELADVPKNGLKVFSCFHCGGGSTMGYKLAGYDVLGGVEIDPEMMAVYRSNHNPKYSYLMGVQDFKKLEDLPPELYNLDILDGSPPCSSFSMAGAREKKWGKSAKFREGQANQVLDDLFFHFIDIAKRLQPKVVVAENVKGLIQGNARGYVKEIFAAFKDAGYSCQLFLLNAAAMGVPQRRERTFFIANKLDKKICFKFEEPQTTVGDVIEEPNHIGKPITGVWQRQQWELAPKGKGAGDGGGYNTYKKLHKALPSFTQTGGHRHFCWDKPHFISDLLVKRIQSFPDDYNENSLDIGYICGMSVPPFMMQRVAREIHRQFFDSTTLLTGEKQGG